MCEVNIRALGKYSLQNYELLLCREHVSPKLYFFLWKLYSIAHIFRLTQKVYSEVTIFPSIAFVTDNTCN